MENSKRSLAAAIDKIKNQSLNGSKTKVFSQVRTSEQMIIDAAQHLNAFEDEELLIEMSPLATVVTVAKFASDAKKFGDKSANLFRSAASALTHQQSNVTLEDKVKALEKALYHLAAGLEAQRHQIGSLVSVNVAGHLLAIKAIKDQS